MLLRTGRYSFLLGVWLVLNILFCLTLSMHTWKTLLVSLFLWFLIGGLGLEVSFHRKVSHSRLPFDFKSKFFTFIGHLGCQGSAIFFSATHLRHHQYSDHHKDPHSPNWGWWHSYVGWSTEFRHVIFGLKGQHANPHIKNSPIFNFLHLYYIEFIWLVWLTLAIISPTALACLVLAQFLSFNQSAFLVNILCHINFPMNRAFEKTTAYNNSLLALFSWGVALHGFHHRYPQKMYYSQRLSEVDLAGCFIRLFWKKDNF